MFRILETPRDAMQSLHKRIPTDEKVRLMNALVKVGFDIIDVGSFVSPKVIPQLDDTAEVINQIDLTESRSKLFVLVANENGAQAAAMIGQITYIGFPFSVSETFLKRNINADMDGAWQTILKLKEICSKTNKKLIVYLTMAFGNPYGDPSTPEILFKWAQKLHEIDIKTVSLSDITGVAKPDQIFSVYSMLTNEFPTTEFGIHLHIREDDWYEKLDAAYTSGCSLYDGVINGFGGCPMTGYELLGNLPTGNIIEFANTKGIPVQVDKSKFNEAKRLATTLFN